MINKDQSNVAKIHFYKKGFRWNVTRQWESSVVIYIYISKPWFRILDRKDSKFVILWAVMYFRVKSINFVSFDDFSYWILEMFRQCSIFVFVCFCFCFLFFFWGGRGLLFFSFLLYCFVLFLFLFFLSLDSYYYFKFSPNDIDICNKFFTFAL